MRVHDHDVSAALAWAAELIGPVTGVHALAGGWTSTMLRLSRSGREDVVLRLMTNEPWRSHGESLTTREREVQQMLASTSVPAPASLALDADGGRCGFPAHLMSLLPGAVENERADEHSLGCLAGLLVEVHAVSPTIDLRTYQSWAWEAKYTPPPWSSDPGLWEDAFALLRTEPPRHERCFLHRDFQPRNVLWSAGAITGLVDWVETSMGPPWLDVAHCCTNLAISHGNAVADRFAEAYAERSGREPQRYFDVMDVVGFLPPPGRTAFVTQERATRRLEERLRLVLSRLDD